MCTFLGIFALSQADVSQTVDVGQSISGTGKPSWT